MATKKKTNVKKKVSKSRSKKQSGTGSSRQKTAGIPNLEIKTLTDTWQDFSRTMRSNMEEILQDNQQQYEKLYGTWNDLSNKFGTQMTENLQSGNKEYTELHNVWKNYTTKLSARLTRLGDNGGIDYEMLLNNWENYIKKMNREIFGDGSKDNITAIFSMWDNFYKDMNRQMEDIIQDGTVLNSELTDIWSDFSQNMNKVITQMSVDSKELKELTDTWDNISKELNKNINNFVKTYDGDITKLQDSWIKQTERVGETLNETFEVLADSYGDIYNKYFERTNPYLKVIDAYSYNRVKRLEKEISDLKKRLEKLEAKSGRK